MRMDCCFLQDCKLVSLLALAVLSPIPMENNRRFVFIHDPTLGLFFPIPIPLIEVDGSTQAIRKPRIPVLEESETVPLISMATC